MPPLTQRHDDLQRKVFVGIEAMNHYASSLARICSAISV